MSALLLGLSGWLLWIGRFALQACQASLDAAQRRGRRSPAWDKLVPATAEMQRSIGELAKRLGSDLAPPTAPSTSFRLADLLDEAQRAGEVHPRGADIAKRALTFGELTVAEVMVPRHRIQAIAYDASMADIRRILLEEGHACMPVYRQNLDQIVGILVVKDVLCLAWERQLIVLDDLLQPPYFAPEVMRAADLLKELQHRRQHFGVVVDELGGTAGIVTIEDLLEELVGDIVGDHDAEVPQPIRFDEGGAACCDGAIPIRDLNRELQLELEEGDAFSTLGGLCIALAGGIPQVGQTLYSAKGDALHVVDACERRVRVVRLAPKQGSQNKETATTREGRCGSSSYLSL